MRPIEIRYYMKHFGLSKEVVELPPTDGEYWSDLPWTPGQKVIVDAILEQRRQSGENGFVFASRFLKYLTQESFEAFGHACSNAIKPAKAIDIDSLAHSLSTIRNGTLSEIRKIPNYHYGVILTTAIEVTGQALDHVHQNEGDDLTQLFESEIVASLPNVEA